VIECQDNAVKIGIFGDSFEDEKFLAANSTNLFFIRFIRG